MNFLSGSQCCILLHLLRTYLDFIQNYDVMKKDKSDSRSFSRCTIDFVPLISWNTYPEIRILFESAALFIYILYIKDSFFEFSDKSHSLTKLNWSFQINFDVELLPTINSLTFQHFFYPIQTKPHIYLRLILSINLKSISSNIW